MVSCADVAGILLYTYRRINYHLARTVAYNKVTLDYQDKVSAKYFILFV